MTYPAKRITFSKGLRNHQALERSRPQERSMIPQPAQPRPRPEQPPRVLMPGARLTDCFWGCSQAKKTPQCNRRPYILGPIWGSFSTSPFCPFKVKGVLQQLEETGQLFAAFPPFVS